jgi:cobalt-precorrin-5B (C1)-methyltransferase
MDVSSATGMMKDNSSLDDIQSVDDFRDITGDQFALGTADKSKSKRKRTTLRKGFTTGTSAAAATKAALIRLVEGKNADCVEVNLPRGGKIPITIKWTQIEGGTATSAVTKDAGDDPDATHGAEILSTVSLNSNIGDIRIEGGKGVGRVTKPGLGLRIGTAAINPVPTIMIKAAVLEVGSRILKTKGITVIISVPLGEAIAKKTDNPRLGILGGISILGTTGIVIPYSTASFAASIRQSLDVAIAMGVDTVALTTGGRSEEFIKRLYENSLPDHSLIQMGDFVGYAIRQCHAKKVKKAIIAGFIGKLTKVAMGAKQTHVKGSHVDMEFMANLALDCACSADLVSKILEANTARHVQEIIHEHRVAGYFDLICERAHEKLMPLAGGSLRLEIVMFDFDGKVCGRYPAGENL